MSSTVNMYFRENYVLEWYYHFFFEIFSVKSQPVRYRPVKKKRGFEALFVNMVWLALRGSHSFCFMYYVITHRCPNFNVGLTKPTLKLGHGWVIT